MQSIDFDTTYNRFRWVTMSFYVSYKNIVKPLCCLHACPSWSALEYFIPTFWTLTLFVRACAIEWRGSQPCDTRCIHVHPFGLLCDLYTLTNSCSILDTVITYTYRHVPHLLSHKNGLFRQPSFLVFLWPEN